jgi:ABC-type nitrate/sulfonate/bicarbonate transport system substrate-binding protein
MARKLSCIVFLMVLLVQGTAFGQTKIKATYGAPSLSVIMIRFGAQAGTFARHGLSMEAVYIAGRSINALLAGDVQFGFIGGPQVIQARISGADVLVIGGLNRLGQMIVTHPSIKTPSDLIGKKVGIGVFGTVADYGMRLGLKQFNLRPNKDVTFIQVGDVPARLGAVTSGAVHAVILNSHDKHYLERFGLKLLTETEDVDFLGSALVTTDSYVRSNRDVVMRFARGAAETIRFIKTEPRRSSEILQKIYRENDPAITARRYQLLTGVYTDYPYVLPSSIQSVLDVLREDGKIKDTPPAQTFMDMTFLQAAEKERQVSGQK